MIDSFPENKKEELHSLIESDLSKADHADFYKRVYHRCCENVIGYITLPVGITNPILINKEYLQIPLSTSEGALIASINRGGKAVSLSGGITTVVKQMGMTRAPIIELPNLECAAKCCNWIEQESSQKYFGDIFEKSSTHLSLKHVRPFQQGRRLFLRFSATTGEAMGMNMITKAVDASLASLKRDHFPEMTVVSVSGNMCTDKKASAVNWIEGRGRNVVTEAVITRKILSEVMHCSASDVDRLNKAKNLIGSAMSGSVGGYNCHASNIVAALFLATGQDAAQVVESSFCLTDTECLDDGSLRISCTLPSVEVGVVGGGTGLPSQHANLALLGCIPLKHNDNREIEGKIVEDTNKKEEDLESKTPFQVFSSSHSDVMGEEKSSSKTLTHAQKGTFSDRLASILGAAVLCGELSLLCSLATGSLMTAHTKLNRGLESPSESLSPSPSALRSPSIATMEDCKKFEINDRFNNFSEKEKMKTRIEAIEKEEKALEEEKKLLKYNLDIMQKEG
ncbi:putative hydroxymethylglutaryl CoA reductase [Monocercomonoides exilis]|uniref:putative hydroxymethylglutaryl CoA reductase n=1 Tax=Monocercomonoides exilis TaxID=2049356 RepID=UPI00355948DC|nr:putative hydroxymethylglutaryl CoA reductase [Monocercomonoides exilis]